MTIFIVSCMDNWAGETNTYDAGIYTTIEKAEAHLKKELFWSRDRREHFHSRATTKDGHLSKVVISRLDVGNDYTEYYIVPKEIE